MTSADTPVQQSQGRWGGGSRRIAGAGVHTQDDCPAGHAQANFVAIMKTETLK
jgi:hypothetical protein